MPVWPQLHLDFITDQRALLRLLMLVMMGVVASSGFATLTLMARDPAPLYFPMVGKEEGGRAETMIEWPQPSERMFNDGEVLAWATQELRRSFTFDFYSADRHLERLYRQSFTRTGEIEHRAIMERAEIPINSGQLYVDFLRSIRSNRQIITAYIVQAPRICRQGPRLAGEYHWWIETVMETARIQDKTLPRFRWAVRLKVIRRPLDETPDALGIDELRIQYYDELAAQGWAPCRAMGDE